MARTARDQLEPVSKMPDQDHQTGQVDESTKDIKAIIPPGDDPPVLMKPSKESFDFPSSTVTPKLASILCRLGSAASHPVGGDHFNSPMPFQPAVQRVAVIGFVSNQPLGKSPCKAVM
jgi:hypothetical protein